MCAKRSSATTAASAIASIRIASSCAGRPTGTGPTIWAATRSRFRESARPVVGVEFNRLDLHVRHFRGRRPVPQPLDEFEYVRLLAAGEHFDRAIGQVLRVAGDARCERALLCAGAIKNTVHSSRHYAAP